jgi:hypothetical protein
MSEQWIILKKDEEGNKYTIHVHLLEKKLKIKSVGLTPKGKRKIRFIGSAMSNEYRGYPVSERGEAARKHILSVVPNHLLIEALREVWESLKPNEINL